MSERDEQIKIAMSHIKLKLKMRGDDPMKLDQKLILESATRLIDDYFKDYNKFPYERVGVIEDEP